MKLVRPPVLSHSPLLTFQEIESNWRKGEEKAGKKRTTSNAGLLMQGNGAEGTVPTTAGQSI